MIGPARCTVKEAYVAAVAVDVFLVVWTVVLILQP